ncbi:Ribosomal protein L28/L24 [Phytophthora cactorum]|nr:Ribosomal protein L28/L24 [Phytophthora cactorum]
MFRSTLRHRTPFKLCISHGVQLDAFPRSFYARGQAPARVWPGSARPLRWARQGVRQQRVVLQAPHAPRVEVNHQWKTLYSEALDEKVGLNVTTHTLRCVDKIGGLDNYLLSIKDERELGVKGLKARDRVLAALAEA